MIKIKLLALLFFTSFLTSSEEKQIKVQNKTTEFSQHLYSITPAKRTKTVKAKYPIGLAMENQEGWVNLSYIIDKYGDVQDVTVLESDGSVLFRPAAIHAVKKWKHTPAKNRQGEDILSCKNSVHYSFIMTQPGLSSSILDLIKESFKVIEKKNINKLKELTTEIDDFKNKRTNDLAWSHYVKSKYFQLTEEKESYYYELKQAYYSIKIKEPIYTESAALDILENLFIMQVEKQLYSNAKETFHKLKQFDSDYAQQLQAYYQPFMIQANQIIKGEKNILVQGQIASDYWYHNLVRNTFSISNVEGKLNEVEVRCDFQHSTYTIKEDNAWKIPKEWGDCSIFVKGESDSTFDVYEIPEQS